MRIVADENIFAVDELFSDLGQLILKPGSQLGRADVMGADALLTRTVTTVNEQLLADTTIQFVGSCSIGTDHLDTQWLDNNNISWANAPGCNAEAVVDYVLAALFALDVDLTSVTVGVVGCGNVGSRLAERVRQYGGNVLCCDPFIEGVGFVRLDELIKQCDVVSLHTPLTGEGEHKTLHLMSESKIQALKPNAVLINTSRGAVIDNQGLEQALDSRSDLSVVLDVWENEPEINISLLKKVALATPHIAGYSLQGKANATVMVYEKLCKHFSVENKYVDPSKLNSMIEKSSKIIDCSGLSLPKILQAAFDIQGQDEVLRQAMLEGREISKNFQHLRNSYSFRDEFSVSRLVNVPQALELPLKDLGFVNIQTG